MKLPSPEYRQSLVRAALGVLGLLVVLAVRLIPSQLAAEAGHCQVETVQTRTRLQDANDLIKGEGAVRAGLVKATAQLEQIEANSLAPKGKLFQWTLKTVLELATNSNVSIEQFSTPTLGDAGMFPGFPYVAAAFKIMGVAALRDLGTFMTDYERKYPYARFQRLAIVQRVEAQPGSSTAGTQPVAAKFAFAVELVTLVSERPED